MKKILLGTTGLVGAAMLLASAASAETPKVTVGGWADFQVGIMNDDLDSGQRSHGFRNDTEVSIKVDGKSDSGLGYGAVVDLEADVTADADGEGLNASRTYLFMDGGWGRFEMGSNQGSATTMKVDASNIARATGGIDGDWTYFANATDEDYITSPDLPLAHGSTLALGGETTDNNNKVTYYSPKFSGFQLGVSYAPDSTDRGQTVLRTDTDLLESGDNFDVGLGYEGAWDDVKLGVAATGQWGDSESSLLEDLGAWNVGAWLGYMGASLAGSYGDWNDSLNFSDSDGNYWTLGAAYAFGEFGASVTYLDSTLEVAGGDDDFNNLSLGVDYKLAPGLTPYAEWSTYEFDAPGAGTDNDGDVFIVGTQLAF